MRSRKKEGVLEGEYEIAMYDTEYEYFNQMDYLYDQYVPVFSSSVSLLNSDQMEIE